MLRKEDVRKPEEWEILSVWLLTKLRRKESKPMLVVEKRRMLLRILKIEKEKLRRKSSFKEEVRRWKLLNSIKEKEEIELAIHDIDVVIIIHRNWNI